jgi:hypothetical protein
MHRPINQDGTRAPGDDALASPPFSTRMPGQNEAASSRLADSNEVAIGLSTFWYPTSARCWLRLGLALAPSGREHLLGSYTRARQSSPSRRGKPGLTKTENATGNYVKVVCGSGQNRPDA